MTKRPLMSFCFVSSVWVYFLYSGVLSAPFIYDDIEQIANNPTLQSWHAVYARFVLAPVSFTSGFLGHGGTTYRPLFWISLALDEHLWGNNAAGFHFTNLFLHGLNGLLLFLLLRRLRLSSQVAGVASLVWQGMPILSESVAWISARAYLLSTAFMLMAVHAALMFLRRKSPASLILFFVFTLLANFSHEQGVLLVGFLAIGYMFLSEQGAQLRWLLLASGALLADGVYFASRSVVGSHAGGGHATPRLVGPEFWKYVQWIALPVHMSMERSTDVPNNATPLSFGLAWAGLAFLLAVVVLLRKAKPDIAASLLVLLLGLLPYCGVVFIYQGMAERFTYIPSIGFVLTIAFATLLLRPFERKIALGCIASWVIWSGWRLIQRVQDWQQPDALFRHSLEASPQSAFLQQNLGVVLRDSGDNDGALSAFQKAVQIKPDYTGAITAIGDIYSGQGKPQLALAEYTRSLFFAPNDPKTILNYAAALQQIGQVSEAETQYKRVITLVPRDGPAYVDLETLYIEEKRYDAAIGIYKKAIAVDPNDADAYFNMGVMFQSIGQNDDALVFYKKALQLKPGDPQTLLYLSKLRDGGDGR